MTIHDRIKLVVKWLIGTGDANNQEAIGRLMGYSNKSSFSQILNNKVPIPSDFTDRLCALNDNINKVWIENEIGDMIVNLSTSISSFDETCSTSNVTSTQSDAIILRLMDKLDKKEAQIDHLQSELRAMTEELATLKAKYPESPTSHPEGLGPSETAPHAPSHPHSPTSEHYYGSSCPPHQENQ